MSPIPTQCITTLQNGFHGHSLIILKKNKQSPTPIWSPHYYLSHIPIVHHRPHTNTTCTRTIWPYQTQHLTQHHPVQSSLQRLFPAYPITLIKESLKSLQLILGFSFKSHQTPNSTITSTPNQHININPNPITCLTWNCGHLSTSLQDIHQLTIINDIPSLLDSYRKQNPPKINP